MATIDRAFSAIALCNMEYRQSDPFFQKTNASGIVESPFHGTSSSQLGQLNSIPVAGGLYNNGSCFNTCSPFPTNPVSEAESMAMFLGNTAPMLNHERSHAISTELTGRVTKRHKPDRDDYDCPSKKRKLSSSPVFEECHAQAAYPGDSVQPCWSNQSRLASPAPSVIQPLDAQSSEMQPILTEEMEEAPAESQSDAALRRIRDIESRLAIEHKDDDDAEEEGSIGRLPTLVMSDVLIESLKQGLDESLTRKIVDSISRPSMELVLWKPQPEFIDKLQSFTSSHKDDLGKSKKGQRTPSEIPFLQNILGVDRPQTVTSGGNTDPTWSKEEEEMEL